MHIGAHKPGVLCLTSFRGVAVTCRKTRRDRSGVAGRRFFADTSVDGDGSLERQGPNRDQERWA